MTRKIVFCLGGGGWRVEGARENGTRRGEERRRRNMVADLVEVLAQRRANNLFTRICIKCTRLFLVYILWGQIFR